MRSIGETARASGLTVSALRFYDRAGVMRPAVVDPHTGYRWYSEPQVRQARLVAGLRRVGMSVADIVAVLGADRPVAHQLLDRHLRRLEDGLTDARRELSRVHTLLDTQETPLTTVSLSHAALSAALESVRFAVGSDPELPALTGIFLDVDAEGVTFVATDRYRMAIHREPATVAGPAARSIAPLSWVDRLRTYAGPDEQVSLRLQDGEIVAAGQGWTIDDVPLPYDYPDYRRAVQARSADGSPRRTLVNTAALRTAVNGAPRVVHPHQGVDHELTVLVVDGDDRIDVVGEEEWRDDQDRCVAVNREFLVDALSAYPDDQLVLELDGPIRPLAVRRAADDRTYSLLMPVKP